LNVLRFEVRAVKKGTCPIRRVTDISGVPAYRTASSFLSSTTNS
jgi:hypothetical protein